MKLSSAQIAQYDEQGYLFFPDLLDSDEVAVLQEALPEILNRRGPEIISEKEDPSSVRLAFGAHTYSEPFRCLTLLPRLLNPVRQLLQDDVYLHQSRMNPKQGFGGGASWDWHQDYPPWHSIDGMPEPNCIMVSVFIDDCTAVTSPLLVVPGSQRHGLLDARLHKDAAGREDMRCITSTMRPLNGSRRRTGSKRWSGRPDRSPSSIATCCTVRPTMSPHGGARSCT